MNYFLLTHTNLNFLEKAGNASNKQSFPFYMHMFACKAFFTPKVVSPEALFESQRSSSDSKSARGDLRRRDLLRPKPFWLEELLWRRSAFGELLWRLKANNGNWTRIFRVTVWYFNRLSYIRRTQSARLETDLNRHYRICNPIHYHYVIKP